MDFVFFLFTLATNSKTPQMPAPKISSITSREKGLRKTTCSINFQEKTEVLCVKTCMLRKPSSLASPGPRHKLKHDL